jgi:transposase-like protein
MEFHDWFAREEDCRAYLVRTRWPEGIQCPRCEARDPWRMKEPFYRCSGCGHDFTVTAGTLFADTHKPLRVWFEAIWHMTNQKNGVSALGLQRALGLGSYRTAWNWLHKLRRAMVRPGRDRLAGVVEVDEAFIGGAEPGKRGRGAAGKSLILVCAQVDGRKIGRIRLARIADASRKSLGEAVQQMVESGAEVQTDGWRGYRGLEIAGYRHRIVRESANPDDLLPRVHQVVSLLKRWLLGTHQGASWADHLDYYLDEFTFRFNRRTSRSRGLLFYRLIEQAVSLSPIKGKSLVGGHPLAPSTTSSG